MTQKALAGVKVLEYARFISGSYCTKLMADLGAEVIKIEPPGEGSEDRRQGPFLQDIPHPERSGHFLYQNTNKIGITLDLKTATGRHIFKRLLKESDLFVQDNPPIQMQDLSLDYAQLEKINPRHITVSITPFGQSGPYCNHRGYAINTSAAGGMSNSIGSPDREPLSPPLSQSHFVSGAVSAVAGLVALFGREKTGQGQEVDVSEADVWAFFSGMMVHNFVHEGRKRVRGGFRTPGFYPYTILPCKDGYMSMIAVLGRQWKTFLKLVGGGEVPDWYAGDPRFRDRWVNSLEHADELDARLSPWLMEHTMKEIFAVCQERHIPFAPVRSIDEAADDPHFKERDYFVEVEHPETGSIKYPGAPYKLSKTPWRVESPAPLLGQHNEKIYCGRLGYSKDELVQLRQAGVI